MFLIDSSAWIDYLRGSDTPARDEVRRMLQEEEPIAVTEPVTMELLAGARPERVGDLQVMTNALTQLPVDANRDYHDAAAIHRAVRSNGNTVRKLLDCLIAAVAVRNQAVVVHKDQDYNRIAECISLKIRSLT